MKKFILLVLMYSGIYAADAATIHLNVVAQQRSKTHLLIMVLGKEPWLTEVAQGIKKNCEWDNQFLVNVEQQSQVQTKQSIQQRASQGYPLLLFLNENSKHEIEWRLYNTRMVNMIAGKKIAKQGTNVRSWAHTISDDLWPVLTGNQGIFSTKIAFCKEIVRKKQQQRYTVICVADYDGSHAQDVVTKPSIYLAPRWNNDAARPLLFYSENTLSNIRLMSRDTFGTCRVASNFVGVNMCPTFSQDGKHVVYCASRGNGPCQLYYYDNNSFKKLTENFGNNISPTFGCDANSIYFCSDSWTGKPQLCKYDIALQTCTPLDNTLNCSCPNFHPKKRQLVYCKLVQGVSQLCIYDEITQEHMQLTHDNAQKDECSWSACGNYLLYAHEEKKKSRIAVFNIHTREQRFITSEQEICRYPAWSQAQLKFLES